VDIDRVKDTEWICLIEWIKDNIRGKSVKYKAEGTEREKEREESIERGRNRELQSTSRRD